MALIFIFIQFYYYYYSPECKIHFPLSILKWTHPISESFHRFKNIIQHSNFVQFYTFLAFSSNSITIIHKFFSKTIILLDDYLLSDSRRILQFSDLAACKLYEKHIFSFCILQFTYCMSFPSSYLYVHFLKIYVISYNLVSSNAILFHFCIFFCTITTMLKYNSGHLLKLQVMLIQNLELITTDVRICITIISSFTYLSIYISMFLALFHTCSIRLLSVINNDIS